MSAAPPSARQGARRRPGKLVDLDRHRLRLVQRSLEETRAELALMEAHWFHVMAEIRRLQRRLEAGAAELALLRERLARTRPATGCGLPERAATSVAVRARRWWERWP